MGDLRKEYEQLTNMLSVLKNPNEIQDNILTTDRSSAIKPWDFVEMNMETEGAVPMDTEGGLSDLSQIKQTEFLEKDRTLSTVSLALDGKRNDSMVKREGKSFVQD